MRPLRVAVACDYLEEGWPSMDLVGESLVRALSGLAAEAVAPTLVRPGFVRRLSCLAPDGRRARNADRFLNRFWDYPRYLERRRDGFDLFHVVDHSYAHLVHALPAERTVVTCHDLDAFRCLLEPAAEPRSAAFRAMARRIQSGLAGAARVICDSRVVRDDLARTGIVAGERLRLAPLGVDPAFRPDPFPAADRAARTLLGDAPDGGVEVLHVGSTVPRKRIDVLLRGFAAVHRRLPAARLVRVGGGLSPAQRALAGELGISLAITELPRLDRPTLAAVYRRAAVTLLPSEREGFGLPLLESLACGTPVVASDLPVLREVGGDAVDYRPVGDAEGLAAAVLDLVAEHGSETARWRARATAAVARARRFSWAAHATEVARVYRELRP